MAEATIWRLLVVDDDETICRQLAEIFAETTINETDRLAVTTTDFDSAFDLLKSGRYDIVILDLRKGSYETNPREEEGAKTFKAIQEKSFVPIIFYTNLPHLVRSLESSVIRVLEKASGPAPLVDSVTEFINSKLPAVNRALIEHVETIQRDYMWNFVVQHWTQFRDRTDYVSLAYLLARRLAVSLSGQGIHKLVENLGGHSGKGVIEDVAPTEDKAHPMEYYVMPPLEGLPPMLGAVLKDESKEAAEYLLLLTPSCDIAQCKVEWALLARCFPLTGQTEYVKWRESQSNTKLNELKALIMNNRQGKKVQPERFYFLPGVFDLPHLVADFQQLINLPFEQLQHLKHVASLDSPFAEELMSRFTRYFGRIGTPDLDPEVIVGKLQEDSQNMAAGHEDKA
jgi:CheY-like chemotaxis protein